MLEVERITDWVGQDVVDADGQRIGKLDEVLFETGTDEAGFASVRTGLLRRRGIFVPLEGAAMARDHIRVPFAKDVVEEAPEIDADDALTAEQEAQLLRHYGLEAPADQTVGEIRYRTQDYEADHAERSRPEAEPEAPPAGATSAPLSEGAPPIAVEEERARELEDATPAEPEPEPERATRPAPIGSEAAAGPGLLERLEDLEARVVALERRGG